MISIELKSCCQDCLDIRGAFDTETCKNLLGDGKAKSRIYCENMNICKKYIECLEPIGGNDCDTDNKKRTLSC